jgi:pimeloyl-ACP methyl ester carboxylesterase
MEEHVIVLHGLALNKWWAMGLAHSLENKGYIVHNISYPSRKLEFEGIVDEFLVPLLNSIRSEKVHLVVHSMGGILARLYAQKYGIQRMGRVVMIGTPNHGSHIVDYARDIGLFKWYFGSAGQDLGTTDKDLPARLGPVTFECGVIAGDSHWLHFPMGLLSDIPVPNDGVVSVESTKVDGMRDHIVLSLDHSLMMWSPETWRLTASFLKTGQFERLPPES